MSYYMICPNCGKGTIGRYATDDSLCGECSDNSGTTDKLSAEKLQEQLNNLAEENNKLRNALEDIMTNTPIQELLDLPFGCSCHEIASEALAAIGGDDE